MATSILPLVTPRPNLNGNSSEQLIAQLVEVINAIRSLENSLEHASDCIHGRNFQFERGPIHRQMASEAWVDRLRIVADLKDEYTQLAVEIQKAAAG